MTGYLCCPSAGIESLAHMASTRYWLFLLSLTALCSCGDPVVPAVQYPYTEIRKNPVSLPLGLSDGSILVSNGPLLRKLTANGAPIKEVSQNAGNFFSILPATPDSVGINGQGYMARLDSSLNVIWELELPDNATRIFTRDGGAYYILFPPSEEHEPPTVTRVNPDGTTGATVEVEKNAYLQFLTDEKSNLIVGIARHRVEVYDTSGQRLSGFDLEGNLEAEVNGAANGRLYLSGDWGARIADYAGDVKVVFPKIPGVFTYALPQEDGTILVNDFAPDQNGVGGLQRFITYTADGQFLAKREYPPMLQWENGPRWISYNSFVGNDYDKLFLTVDNLPTFSRSFELTLDAVDNPYEPFHGETIVTHVADGHRAQARVIGNRVYVAFVDDLRVYDLNGVLLGTIATESSTTLVHTEPEGAVNG